MEDTKQVTVHEAVDKRVIREYLDAFGYAGQLTPKEANQFVEIASAFNLNPFKREIHCVPYGTGEYRKLSIVTGYEVYLKRADRTGLLDGWECRIEGSLKTVQIEKKGKGGGTYKADAMRGDLKAVIAIYRKDRSKPIIWEAYHDEVTQDNAIWVKSPRFMVRKVVIAQGFRFAFPDEMGGMPYTTDELPDEMTAIRHAEGQETPPEVLHNTDSRPVDEPLGPAMKISAMMDELAATMKSEGPQGPWFNDTERTKARRKAQVGKGDTQAYAEYLESLLGEYKDALWIKVSMPAEEPQPELEVF